MEDALNLSVLLDFFVTVAASVYFVPQLERGLMKMILISGGICRMIPTKLRWKCSCLSGMFFLEIFVTISPKIIPMSRVLK